MTSSAEIQDQEQAQHVQQNFHHNQFSVQVEHIPSVTSTQTHLRQHHLPTLSASDISRRIFIFSASHQTQGRGKGDRTWFSDSSSKCLALSFLLPIPHSLISRSAFITQLLAYACCESIGISTKIKWPNDLILNGHKIGGILAELEPVNDSVCAMIIGVGINIDIDGEVLERSIVDNRWPPSSIKKELGKDLDFFKFRDLIIDKFLFYFYYFINGGNFDVLDRISARQYMFNDVVRFGIDDVFVFGRHVGLAADGGLKLEVNGEVKLYYSGEFVLS